MEGCVREVRGLGEDGGGVRSAMRGDMPMTTMR
jgi:hypothetical protein